MGKCTAFVLGGGGSHGSLQVGAVRALLEAGIVPDLLVGTSIGAVNATGLAMWGADLHGIDALEQGWKEFSGEQLLDPRIGRLLMRTMLGRTSDLARNKVTGYLETKGLTHSLKFHQLKRVRLALISADIETGQPVIYGQNPDDSVLEGLLASIAVPPWFAPFQKNSQLMVDGGALSNLPIEPAMRLGATEIFAFDLDDIVKLPTENLTFLEYIQKFIYSISRRYVFLETSLAEARGIPVHCIEFRGLSTDPIWDFTNAQPLIRAGYERARQKISEWDRAA